MSASTSLPDFNSYQSLGLENTWLANTVDNFGYLLIEHADTLKNGRFKVTTVGITNNVFNGSGFTVYSSELTAPDATKVTNGQLKTGDKIYYYNHNDQTHTLVATVDTTLDGYYDDLKINFNTQISLSNATVLALGEALQYGAGSLGARSLTVSLYDTNNAKLDNTAVPASANSIVLNSAIDGFSFEDIRLSFTENANTIFAAAGSDTSIAYSAKDTLESGVGNYNGTFLEISAVSDSTAYMAALGDLNGAAEMSPEFFNALNRILGVILSDAQGQKLGIDATDKSFTYDAQTHTLKVGNDSFATVSFGGELGNANNPIKIEFTSNLATKALVNEVLQSITYQNTQDALFPLSVISWNLKQQTGVDANNVPIISTLTSGQSLITLTAVNDAPLLRPNSKIISYTERLDFDGQIADALAIQEDVYSSDNTSVVSNDLLSKGAGVLVATNGSSTFTFDSPQTSVSLNFFNGIKAFANLSTDELTALGDAVMELMMAGLPYHKVSFFNTNNELLGISEVTDLDTSSLSLFFQLMIFSESGDNTLLLGLLPELDKLYNARFTAPQGQTIASVKVEGVATTLTNVMQQPGTFPVLLDSITLGEVTTPVLNLPPLTEGQTTEFLVGDMIPTGTIIDPDIFPWDKNTTPKAIAVSAVDSTKGEWKYSTDGGNTWIAFNFANQNVGTALLLTENDRLQFTPNSSFDGVLNNAITFYAWDKTTGTAGSYLTISGNTGTDKTLSIDSVSASAMTPQAPTLTEIASIPAQNTATQEITFAQLLAASDATDLDGDVVAFVVKSVSGGTLKIGVDANTATDFDNETVVSVETNDTITAVKKIFWTPTESNAVFSVVAKDNDGTESATPVDVRVERINHEPVITSTPITTTNEDSIYSYSLTATDADGDSLIWSVTNGETLPAWLSLLNASSATSDFATGIPSPGGVASDTAVNTYVISQESPYQIYKIAPNGTKTNFGQTNINGTSLGMIFDSGNLYVSVSEGTDAGKIFKYGSNGTQSLFATVGNDPRGMTIRDDFMYVANYSANKIQKVDLSHGTVSDYKAVGRPFGVVFDATGVMYVGKYFENQIVKFLTTDTHEAETLVVTTDEKPTDLKIDANNNLYVSTMGGGLFKYENLGIGTKTHITSPDRIWGMSLNSNGTILMGDDDSTLVGDVTQNNNKVVKFQTATVLTGTPTNDHVGSHNIKLSVSDSTATVAHDFTLTVTNVNDAPTGLGNLTLASVQQNTALPAGAAISALTGLNFVDVDAGSSLGGVVVVENTANPDTQGTWQYSTNAGTNWFDVGKVADNATALALSATTRVRFVPVANYSGTPPTLTVRAIDETYHGDFSTTVGTETRVTVNAETNDGTTAISANTNTISTMITTPPPPPADPEPTPQPTPPVVEQPKPEPQKPVSKEVEMQVPSASGVKGDGNGDGIPDVEQKNVISLPTQKDLRETVDAPKVFLSIELPQGQTLTKAEVKPMAEMIKEKPITVVTETVNDKGETVTVETQVTEENAPFGLFEFNFAGVPTTTDSSGNLKGGTTDVKLYLDDNQTVEKYLKQTVSGTWETIPFTYVYDEKLGKTVVSISLTDGDKFDLDGKVDGNIADPGTPIILPKLTAAPEPVVVEILPQPLTKVFVGYDRTFTLDSGAAKIYGQGEREVVELGANASNVIIDQNVEQVKFAGLQSDYSFEQKGNTLQVAKGSTMIAQITIQNDANGSLLSFENSLQSAKLVAGVIRLEPYTVVIEDIPRSIYNTASIFTVQGEIISINSQLVDVYGSIGSDVISLAANATKISVNQNVGQINFAGNFADYRFVTVGNTLDILVSTTQIANVNVQDDSNGTKLNFADSEHFAKFVQPTTDTPFSIEITGVATLF